MTDGGGAAMSARARSLCGMLGLARRAGKLAMGMSAVERLVHGGEKPLVILASDAGSSLKTTVARWEPLQGVVDDVLTGDDMAETFGRGKLAVVAVADPGFVRGIMKKLRESETG